MYQVALTLACVAFVAGQQVTTPGPNEVTIDAAFRYEGTLYLISGREYMIVSPSGFERYVKVRTGNSEVPVDVQVQAAVQWPRKPLVYFFGDDVSYKNNQSSRTSKARAYRRGREFLRTEGPDAAAFKSGRFYIFKGCQFVAQRATMWYLGEPQPVNDLGLPCDIDAAWTDEDTRGMTILKGDQIWKWREEVTGPHPFSDDYHIWSWRLKASQEELFEF